MFCSPICIGDGSHVGDNRARTRKRTRTGRRLSTSKRRRTIGADDPFGPGAAPGAKRTRPLTRSLASKMGEVWDRWPG